MRVNSLANVSVTERTKRINDLLEVTKCYENARIKKDKIDACLGFLPKCDFPDSEKIVTLVKVNNRLFAASETGKIYEIMGSGYRLLFISPTTKFIGESITFNGEDAIALIFSGGEYYIVKNGGDVTTGTFPFYPKDCCRVGELICFAKDSKLVFDKSYNFTSITTSTKNFINFPSDAGEILSVIPSGKKALVVLNNAIYELTAFGETIDYQVKRFATFNEQIIDNTVKKVGEYIYFIAGDTLYKCSDGNVSKINTVIQFKDYLALGKASTIDGKYLLPLSNKQGKNGVFVFDTIKGEEGLCIGDINSLVDGGYFIKDSSVKILDENGLIFGGTCWQSALLDLGTRKKKVLKGVSVTVSGDCRFTITGENDSKEVVLKEGINQKKLKLDSRVFDIKISSESRIVISDIELTYRIKGE